MMHHAVPNQPAEFHAVNVEGTLRPAPQAAEAAVRRFVFISSIKVNGEETTANGSFTVDDPPASAGPCGITKLEVELGLRQLARDTGLEIVDIRPVFVYGRGVKTIFRAMMH